MSKVSSRKIREYAEAFVAEVKSEGIDIIGLTGIEELHDYTDPNQILDDVAGDIIWNKDGTLDCPLCNRIFEEAETIIAYENAVASGRA